MSGTLAQGKDWGKILKRCFITAVILQVVFLTGWYGWSSLTSTRTATATEILNPIARTFSLKTLTTQEHDGRELESVSLRVGKKQGIFNFYVYKPRGNFNRASLLINGCAEKVQHDGDQIQLITSFIDYTRNKVYRKTIEHMSMDNLLIDKMIEVRQMEVLAVLQDNLHHMSIGRIHILVWERETAEYIKSLPMENSEKLVLRVIGKDVGLKEQLLYASECLRGKVIAISNQDNKFGKGWNNKEYKDILRRSDIMYALTRHSPTKTNCTWLKAAANCDEGSPHIGSHDTFVLRAKRWTADALNELNSITPDKPGMENLFIWFFKNSLKYRILNPCKKLFVHHQHCVPLRGKNRPRVNTGGKSLSIEFTDKLS